MSSDKFKEKFDEKEVERYESILDKVHAAEDRRKGYKVESVESFLFRGGKIGVYNKNGRFVTSKENTKCEFLFHVVDLDNDEIIFRCDDRAQADTRVLELIRDKGINARCKVNVGVK